MPPRSRAHASFSRPAVAAVTADLAARLPRALPLPQVDQLAASAGALTASALASTPTTAAAIHAGRQARAHPLRHAIAARSYRGHLPAPCASQRTLTACLQPRTSTREAGWQVRNR